MARNVTLADLPERYQLQAAAQIRAMLPVAEEPKKSKYGNVPQTVDGVRLDSKAEAARYGDLLLLQRAGKVRDLKVHTRFPLMVGPILVATYEDDFDYIEDGALVVEDVKGAKTAEYRIKKRLMLAVHGIEIREIAA